MKNILLFMLLLIGIPFIYALSPAELEALDKRASVENFPDAHTVLMYDDQKITYQTDGTAVDIDDMYEKVLTDKGARELSSISMAFNVFYQKYTIEILEIIRNGKVIKIDISANSRISIDNSQMSANIFDPNDKILSVNVPGLQKGDILHIKVCRETIRPRMKGFFSDVTVLQSINPILYYKIEYNAPESMPLRSVFVKNELKNKLKRSEKKADGRIIYTFVAENVPQIVPEHDSPPVYLYCRRLLVSTAAKWQEISVWYDKLCQPHLDKVTPQMKDFVKKLIKDCKTPDEKLRKIFNFVSQDIRYMGVTTETEAPGYEPHDVNITFEKRYGVCRDKAALLVALLRLADIPAYMTLFYAGAPKDAEVPNNYFNHAVVAAQLPGSKDYILMDPTDENTSELLPAYGANKSYLVARKDGDILRLSAGVPADKNITEIVNDWYVSKDGDLSGSSTIYFKGINDNIYRDAFANWDDAYKKQFFNIIFNRIFPGVEISKIVISPSKIRDIRQILSVKIDFSVKNFVKSSDSISIFPSHDLNGFFGAMMMMFKKIDLNTRRYPLQFFSSCAVSEKTSVIFADSNVRAVLPSYSDFKSPLFTFRGSTSMKNGVLKESKYIALNSIFVDPADYPELRRQTADIEKELNKNVFMLPADVAASVDGKTVIYDLYRKEYTFTDARNWDLVTTVNKKVLNYAGVKEEAELAVPFDSGMEKVVLLSASVKTPDGKIHKISPTEVHVMDSGTTSETPFYAAAKILTVKFPHVVPGAIISYQIKKEVRNAPFFSISESFAGYFDCKLMEVIFKDIPPQFDMSPVPAAVAKTGSGNNITLRKKNIKRIPVEIRQAPIEMFADTVFCSTINFQEYCSELSIRLNRAAANSPLAAAKAVELAGKIAIPAEKIIAIRDFVDKNIRLAGPALNDYNWKFSSADQTLKRGCGNSADRAVLFKAMLNAIGMKSDFIARSNIGAPDLKEQYFSHSLRYFQNIYNRINVCVYHNNRPIAMLNDNSRYAPVSFDRNAGKVGLNLSRRLPLLRSTGAFERSVKEVRLVISPELKVIADITLIFSSSDAENVRRTLTENNKRQKEQFFDRLGFNFSPLARLKKNWEVKDDKDTVSLSASFELDNIIRKNGDYAALELPYLAIPGNSIPAVADRKTPIWNNSSHLTSINYVIELPSNYQLASNPPENISRRINDFYGFRFTSVSENNTLKISTALANTAGILHPENAAALPSFKKLLLSPEFNYIFLVKKSAKK